MQQELMALSEQLWSILSIWFLFMHAKWIFIAKLGVPKNGPYTGNADVTYCELC